MSLISLICKLFEQQLFTAFWLAAVGMYLLDVVTLIWEMRRCAVSLFIFCFGAEVLTTFCPSIKSFNDRKTIPSDKVSRYWLCKHCF